MVQKREELFSFFDWYKKERNYFLFGVEEGNETKVSRPKPTPKPAPTPTPIACSPLIYLPYFLLQSHVLSCLILLAVLSCLASSCHVLSHIAVYLFVALGKEDKLRMGDRVKRKNLGLFAQPGAVPRVVYYAEARKD